MLQSPAEISQKKFLENCKIAKFDFLNTVLNRKYTLHLKIADKPNLKIYRAINGQNKKQYVIKIYDFISLDQQTIQIKKKKIYLEILFMRSSNTDMFLKSYEIYERQENIAVVQQFYNQGTLEEYLDMHKLMPHDRIQLIKKIFNITEQIHGYEFNLKSLNLSSIFLKNDGFKLKDFSFLHQQTPTSNLLPPQYSKASSKTQDVWFLGLFYLSVVFRGTRRIQEQMEKYRNGNIPEAPSLFTKNLQGQIQCINLQRSQKEFLKNSLKFDAQQRLSWINLQGLDFFRNQNLLNTKRFFLQKELNFMRVLSKNQQTPVFQREQIKNLSISRLKQRINIEQFSFICVNKSDIYYYCEDTDNQEQRLYDEMHKNFFQTKKVYFILNSVIIEIQNQKHLQMKKRQEIQFMYLLCSRCFMDASRIESQLKKFESIMSEEFEAKTTKIYIIAKQKFEQYSKKLTIQEDKFLSVIKDKMNKIIAEKTTTRKVRFLEGIQNIDYKRQQQIQYTQNQYLQSIKNKINLKPGPENRKRKILDNLTIYPKICRLSKKQNQSFQEALSSLYQNIYPQ